MAVIDLFAGAGGASLGAAAAGGDVRLSVEWDEAACATLAANSAAHHGSVLCADISAIGAEELRRKAGLRKSDPLVIVGGPPCQPFSKAAYWTDPGDDARFRRERTAGRKATRPTPILVPQPDSRRDLLFHFARLVIETKAVGFMFENVPSLLHPRNRSTFERFRASLESAGFETVLSEANAAAFGVPQVRKRVVLVGFRGGAVAAPHPTHGNVDEFPHASLKPPVGAAKAIKRFASRRFAEVGEEVVGRWASALKEIPPGMNYKALTAWFNHPQPLFEAETRFWSFLLKLHPDRPSWTVAANPGPWVGPFHWDSRRLRIPEMAALQSFPEGYEFCGSRRERIRQIGNAMPPLLASAFLTPLLEAVSGSN